MRSGAVFVRMEGVTCVMELQKTEQQNRTVVLNDVSIITTRYV